MTEIGGRKVWYDEKNRMYMREVATPLGVVNASTDYADNLYPDEPDRTLGSGAGQFREDYVYDSLNRLKETKTEYGSVTTTCSLKQTTAYNDSQTETGEGQYASGLVKTLTVRDGKKADSQPALSVYTLEYDAEGNAVKVTHGKPHAVASLGTSTEASYEYDKLNRLTRENNQRLGKTWTYGYDAGGNITSKKEYAYATTELDNAIPIETQEYVYRASGWKDRLVSFCGEEISYDASGNPTSYRGATLGFEGGRRLKSYKKANDSDAYEFAYDADNLRQTKTHKEASGYDKTWTYWNTDGKLWGERITEKVFVGNFGILILQDKVTEISYAHLSTGLAGFTVKEQTGTAAAVTKSYLYRKNALGDIDAIYDTDMNLVGEYVYDAWGNCTIEAAGTDNLAIMQLNPFRYRGYYWDKELNLYYLQTRYYDPETGRFINADCITYSAPIIVNGLNLYSYCANNPILRFDPNGNSFWKNVGKVIGGALLLLAGAATALLTLPIAVSVPGCGFLTQVGFSTASYGGLMIGSVFDSQIQADMDEIGWNPFNKNENAVLNSTKVSFYKGIPIFRKEAGFRSGSFLCILLARGDDVNDLRHEWGHTIQQGILGAVRYGLMIGIPSWQSWGKKDYYDKPWEVTADYFGGVEGRSHKDHDISAGINYLAAVAIWGILGTLFLIGEY